MKLNEAVAKLQDAIMASFDPLEDVEYRRKLWLQVFETMEKHKLAVSAVTVTRPLDPPTARKERKEPAPWSIDGDDDIDDPSMPFGKYGGTPVSQLPPDYVRWAVQNIKFTQERFRPVEEALQARARALGSPRKASDSGKVPY